MLSFFVDVATQWKMLSFWMKLIAHQTWEMWSWNSHLNLGRSGEQLHNAYYEHNKTRAKFPVLVDFIEKHARIVSDPMFGDIQDVMPKRDIKVYKSPSNKPAHGYKGSSFVTVTSPGCHDLSVLCFVLSLSVSGFLFCFNVMICLCCVLSCLFLSLVSCFVLNCFPPCVLSDPTPCVCLPVVSFPGVSDCASLCSPVALVFLPTLSSCVLSCDYPSVYLVLSCPVLHVCSSSFHVPATCRLCLFMSPACSRL